jgi:signal transduction histidine kinase
MGYIRGDRGGAVQPALGRLYERLGSRVVLVGTAWGILAVLASGLVAATVGARYLRLSGSELTLLVATGIVIELMAGVATLAMSRGIFSTSLSWSGPGRAAARAPEVWENTVHAPYVIGRRFVMASAPAVPALTVAVVLVADTPAYATLPVAVGLSACLIGAAILAVFGAELVNRPMLEDVATHLEPGFEPAARAWRLRTKALSPLPVVTFFSALTVGGFVDVVETGALQLTIAVGFALITVALSGLVFFVVTRSTLDPLDDLIAATRRVRAGDIATRVPVVTADELGQLAQSFNRMLDDLRLGADELRSSRARIVAAADEERLRVERDLHDGAQQQLVLLQLNLRLLEEIVGSDPAEASALARRLQTDVANAIDNLRDLAHGIYPALLESDGLPAALSEAAECAAIPASFDCDHAGRYRRELEAAIYFCCLEALQNAAKHAGEGARVRVSLGERGGEVAFEVADDGAGFDPAGTQAGAGLQSMADRIGALGGKLRIVSAAGLGTRITGSVPL